MNRRQLLMATGATIGASIFGAPAVALTRIAPPDVYYVNGVAVRHYRPTRHLRQWSKARSDRPVIIMVHGGAHAGWVFERHAAYFACNGWDCHVIDWYHHGLSDPLSLDAFIARSITDVRTEIGLVVDALPQRSDYVVIGQSMGGLASLYAAQSLNPAALVLVTPVVSAEVGAAPIPIPIDMTQPFAVPPFNIAKGMFYSTMSDAEAQVYYQLLQPESPQAVWEATRWTVSVNLDRIRTPTMTVAAEADTLTPPDVIRQLGTMLRSRHVEWPGMGHCDVLLKERDWLPVAQDIERWLCASTH